MTMRTTALAVLVLLAGCKCSCVGTHLETWALKQERLNRIKKEHCDSVGGRLEYGYTDLGDDNIVPVAKRCIQRLPGQERQL